MSRFARTIVAAALLVLPLAACSDFDPTSMFDSEIFNPKKPLPGTRKELFPSGTPGVPQGVPPELYKGYQAPVAAANPDLGQDGAAGSVARGRSPDAPEEQPKPKPKPKPKVAAAPSPQRSTPTSVTVRPDQPAATPAGPYQWPDAPAQNGQAAAPSGGAQPGWPNSPAPGTFGR